MNSAWQLVCSIYVCLLNKIKQPLETPGLLRSLQVEPSWDVRGTESLNPRPWGCVTKAARRRPEAGRVERMVRPGRCCPSPFPPARPPGNRLALSKPSLMAVPLRTLLVAVGPHADWPTTSASQSRAQREQWGSEAPAGGGCEQKSEATIKPETCGFSPRQSVSLRVNSNWNSEVNWILTGSPSPLRSRQRVECNTPRPVSPPGSGPYLPHLPSHQILTQPRRNVERPSFVSFLCTPPPHLPSPTFYPLSLPPSHFPRFIQGSGCVFRQR